MGLVGFNPQEVNFALTTYENSYEAIMDRIGDLQTKFINAMSDKWACQYAVDFFAAFKTDIEALIKDIDVTFASINESVNSAADAWDEATGGNQFTKKSFSTRGLTLNVDCIKENINGVRGAEPGIKDVAELILPYTYDQIEYQLKGCVTATNASGFIGGSQQDKLISKLTEIKNAASTAMNNLLTDVNTAIKNTDEAYGTLETKVSSAFSGEGA